MLQTVRDQTFNGLSLLSDIYEVLDANAQFELSQREEDLQKREQVLQKRERELLECDIPTLMQNRSDLLLYIEHREQQLQALWQAEIGNMVAQIEQEQQAQQLKWAECREKELQDHFRSTMTQREREFSHREQRLQRHYEQSLENSSARWQRQWDRREAKLTAMFEALKLENTMLQRKFTVSTKAAGQNEVKKLQVVIYNLKWERLKTTEPLNLEFSGIPWPVFNEVNGSDDVNPSEISAFYGFLCRHRPKETMTDELKRWHTDKMDPLINKHITPVHIEQVNQSARNVLHYLLNRRKKTG